ncbi:putative oxidoreductase [Medicago truncatula]|uniref:Putative oxidoreductase n=1 Tax=Medicago truncatula TaxID=3880 RepID=A0A396GQ69_MEDTR|nr:putative oxidoreductase [Medicago truncatula]
MSIICNILNVALPPLSLILLPIIMLPYIFFKLLIYIKRLVRTENMARKVVLPPLDHLVNNAGVIGVPRLVEDFSDLSKYTQIMETNFWGAAARGTLYAIPHLKNSKGRIIVVDSACGWFPASKAAIIISFFETLRIELGWSIGITIATTPGFIKTYLATLGRLPLGSSVECAKDIVKGFKFKKWIYNSFRGYVI